MKFKDIKDLKENRCIFDRGNISHCPKNASHR